MDESIISNDEFIFKCLKEEPEEEKKESESSEEENEHTIPWYTMVDKTDV